MRFDVTIGADKNGKMITNNLMNYKIPTRKYSNRPQVVIYSQLCYSKVEDIMQ